MVKQSPVFDQILADYLKQVATLDHRARISDVLGVTCVDGGFRVPVFNRSITVTDRGSKNSL